MLTGMILQVSVHVLPRKLAWNLKIDPLGKGDPIWKLACPGSILNFGGVKIPN